MIWIINLKFWFMRMAIAGLGPRCWLRAAHAGSFGNPRGSVRTEQTLDGTKPSSVHDYMVLQRPELRGITERCADHLNKVTRGTIPRPQPVPARLIARCRLLASSGKPANALKARASEEETDQSMRPRAAIARRSRGE